MHRTFSSQHRFEKHQEAIEEAIYHGWIDSKGKKRGPDSFYLCFNQRNPKSTWGRLSRERADRMIRTGLMSAHGQKMVDLAKSTGTWAAHDAAQRMEIPEDLRRLLESNPKAEENFERFAPSSKRIVLEWISKAKRAETRQRRVALAVELATHNQIGGLPKGLNESRAGRGRSS